MSDTPLTDQAARLAHEKYGDDYEARLAYMESHGETMELMLAACRDERDEAVKKMEMGWIQVCQTGIGDAVARAEKAEADLARLTEERDAWKESAEASVKYGQELEAENEALEREVEGLRYDLQRAT